MALAARLPYGWGANVVACGSVGRGGGGGGGGEGATAESSLLLLKVTLLITVQQKVVGGRHWVRLPGLERDFPLRLENSC